MERLRSIVRDIDWVLLIPVLILVGAGLVTMSSFVRGGDYFFDNQLVWAVLGVSIFFILSFIDFRFLRRTSIVVIFYFMTILLLLLLFIFGEIVLGAQSRFNLGIFAVQPADPAKLVLILVLAKYFSRRHIEIAHIRHILVSGGYAFLLFTLVLVQPDFGSAIILAAIWFGMVLVSGISKKHLISVILIATIVFAGLWTFVFEDYQKDRIRTFINPLTDLQGTGYNAYQSTIAVGSGEIIGKGVGYGTQSKLQFLPEYETDFIFAAFAEEWGFLGVLILFILFVIVWWRILSYAFYGASNFETLFAVGVALMFLAHFVVHVGMNIGLLPVTGTTVPFLSYGGSHLITEFVALGILMGMRRYSRAIHREDINKEFLGV
ncbi:MAG TPA: rod shape-determining protein RodA [Candidatus Paceibacterota bacterium]